jgi:hypothetical protein
MRSTIRVEEDSPARLLSIVDLYDCLGSEWIVGKPSPTRFLGGKMGFSMYGR